MNTRVLAGAFIGFVSVAYLSAQSTAPTKTGAKPTAAPQAAPQPAAPRPAAAVETKAAVDPAVPRKLMDQYCVTCHNAKTKTANLLLDQLDLAHLGDHPEIGEKVVRKLLEKK